MKILHCPTDVGGHGWCLSRAERKLGLDSKVMVLQKSWLGFPTDIDLQFERSSRAAKAWKLLNFFIKAAADFDIFHFNFGSSFLTNLPYFAFFELSDLAALRAMGKKIIVTYQGCDVRQKDFCTTNFPISACANPNCYGGICDSKTDQLKRKRAAKFSRYAHRIFAINPDLLYVLPNRAEFIPAARVDLDEWHPVKDIRKEKSFIIVHSPTDSSAKGTKYIVNAVEKLKHDYHNVDLLLVQNIPHCQVKQIYSQADLAIDQLLVGWYGRFAIEMMALGKPVVCYIRREDLKFVPTDMREDLPLIDADPENIYEVLKRLMEERQRLNQIGVLCRTYVEKWHDPIKIAKKMKEVYESLCAE